MGLFSKHKSSEASAQAPPVPASSNSGNDSSSKAGDIGSLNAPPMPEMSQSGNLSPPPIPGGSGLEDIKEQVSSQGNDSNSNKFDMPDESNSSSLDSSSDSLFDDMFNEEPVTDLNKDNASNAQEKPQNNSSSAFDISEFDSSPEVTDTNMGRSDSLGFVRGGHYNSHSGKDSCFLTTVQFKTLLEIVEGVKSKVKDSTEIHLRLMDIKSEEDIEYENLRKNFAQMEDKLYELDTILFEEDK